MSLLDDFRNCRQSQAAAAEICRYYNAPAAVKYVGIENAEMVYILCDSCHKKIMSHLHFTTKVIPGNTDGFLLDITGYTIKE